MIELLLEAERALAVGLLDRAEILYGQVASADPRNSIAVVGLARVQLDRGDDQRALDLSRRALRIDPENAAAQRMVARIEEVMEYRNGVEELEAGDVEATDAPDAEPAVAAAEADEAEAAHGADDTRPPIEAAETTIEPAPTPTDPNLQPWAMAGADRESATTAWPARAGDADPRSTEAFDVANAGRSGSFDDAPDEPRAAAAAAQPDWPVAQPASAPNATDPAEFAPIDGLPPLDSSWSPQGAGTEEPSASTAVRSWLDRVFRRPPR